MHDLTEIIGLCVQYLDAIETDSSVTKKDVCNDIRNRLCVMLGMVIGNPVSTNYALPYVEIDPMANNQTGLEKFLYS